MAYSYYRAITVDRSKIPTTQTNFPFPVAGTLTYLKTVANGGLVTSASGFDIQFYSDAALTTPLKFERTLHVATTGQVAFYVKVPAANGVAAGSDTVIYMAYGNAAIVTDQQDAVNVWDVNYKAVYHFGDGTTLNLNDSTSNAQHLTNAGLVAAAGLVAGAASGNGTSQYAERSTSAPVTTYPATFETTFKPSASVAANRVVACVNERANGTTIGLGVRARATDAVRAQAGAAVDTQTANGVLNTTSWHYAGAVFTSDAVRRLLVDGAAAIVGSTAAGAFGTVDDFSVACSFNNNVAGTFFAGLIAEVRVSNITRADDWITATHNSLVGIATFYAIGAQQTTGGGTFSFTTQPPASVASGATMATVAVTADASASGLTCTLTLAGPNGSATGLSAVCNASGVATFSAIVVTGDGPGYTLAAAITGYTGSVSSSFTVIGAVVAANQAFVTAMGGDALLFTVHDPRVYANGALASFPDTIGPIGGRAAGLTLAGPGVTVAGGKLSIVPASSPDLESAADARLQLAATFASPRPCWLLTVCVANAAGPLVGIAANPTSTVTYPYLYAQPAGPTYQAAFASDGATPTPTNPPIPNTAGIWTSDSFVPFAGGATRAMAVGKLGYQSAVSDQGNNINHVWGFLPCMAGKQPRFIHRATVATAGNCKLVVGRFGTSYGDGTVSYVAVFGGDMTVARLRTWHAFARAQFGATVDIVAIPSLGFPANSLGNSTTQQVGGDMQNPTAGSGTTSMPYYMANKTSGARGSLVTQGLDVAEVHSFAWARSGGSIQAVIDTFDVELALLADGTRTGNIVILHFDIGNSLATMTVAQYLAACVTLKGLCDSLAASSGLTVNLVQLPDADRVGYYNASYPTIPTAYSAAGTDRVSIGATLLASPATYARAVFDTASLANEQIGFFSAPKCYSATYFNITANGAFGGGDATHQAPPGYQVLGEGIKAFLDANDWLLYTTYTDTLRGAIQAGQRLTGQITTQPG